MPARSVRSGARLRRVLIALCAVGCLPTIALAEKSPKPRDQDRPPAAEPAAAKSEPPEPSPSEAGAAAKPPRPPASTPGRKAAVIQERVMVIGGPDKLFEIPGSAHYIGEAELRKNQYNDVHRVLRQVPGINLQEEDGYGLRPNIGMRGTGVERSQKITLMEDGVLFAPAPYAAPAAYYFPVTGRMRGFEVRKGSSSIKQGPYTNGGALNLLSRSVPDSFGGELRLAAGSDGLQRAHAHLGDSRTHFGWVLETYQMESDGFKELDTGGKTGFDLGDYMAKVRLNSGPRARRYQSLELKLGKTDQLGHETYLGLAADDFARQPYRRYAASQEDFITSDHENLSLTHFVQASTDLDITTTLYRNDFYRNWHKLESVSGTKIRDVLEFPDVYSAELAILRGEADSAPDELGVRNNRREYFSRGVQSIVGFRLGSGSARHAMELGLRYHEDQEDRFQEDDRFHMLGGEMTLTSLGDPGSNANRINEAQAIAAFFQDTISLDRWTITPGVRFEHIDFARIDYGRDDPDRLGTGLDVRENRVRELIPGVGATYRFSPGLSLFGGVHKGFSPPGPGADERTRPEESVNYELGARLAQGGLRAQAVVFYNDYDNLLGRDTLSSGGTGSGDLFNGGAIRISGLEASVSRDLGGTNRRSVSVPARLAYTYTTGEFRNSFETDFADWAPAVEAGDGLPYLPEHQLFGELGLIVGPWSLFLNASYVGEMRTHAGQGPIPSGERIEDHLLFDLSLARGFLKRYEAFLQIRNLTDEVYVAARRPAGLRPGLPRSVLMGLAVRF